VELVAAIVTSLRLSGLRVVAATGWEDYDARILGSISLHGDLVTSAHPVGSIQLRIRRRPRWAALGIIAAILALVALVSFWVAMLLLGVVAVDVVAGVWRTGGRVRRIITGKAALEPT
jgi:hypothetical protein